MSDLRVEPVTDRAGTDAFVRLPWAIFHDDPNWIPPLLMERREAIDRNKNPYFRHAEVEFWVARRNGRPVGRISAQVDREHLATHQDATGHFGYIDAEDDPEVFAALLSTAEGWLRARGMARAAGPFSLSTNEETGLLVDGFDRPPSMLMEHARPYYGSRVEEQGYAKLKDVVCFDYDVAPELPPASRLLLDRRLAKMPGYRMRALKMRDYDREIRVVMDIFNDAWARNWGFVPFTEAEIEHTAKAMKPLIVPDMIAVAEIHGEPAAMALCIPNINEAIADLDGKLLPLGWAKLLWRLKVQKLRSGRVPLMGVRQKYRNGPAGTALALAVIDRMREGAWRYGLKQAELGWVLEGNVSVRRLIESVGGRVYKTYRVYAKDLA
jgi:hypothetical protein